MKTQISKKKNKKINQLTKKFLVSKKQHIKLSINYNYKRTKIIKTELLDKIEDFYNQFLIEYKEQLQNQLKDWRE